MTLVALLSVLSRSVFGHQYSSNLAIISQILNRSGIISNFNNFHNNCLWPELQLQPCLIQENINRNQLSSSLIMDYLSEGTFYGRSYMKN